MAGVDVVADLAAEQERLESLLDDLTDQSSTSPRPRSSSARPSPAEHARLAEHWAHGLDITGPLNLPYPDTEAA